MGENLNFTEEIIENSAIDVWAAQKQAEGRQNINNENLTAAYSKIEEVRKSIEERRLLGLSHKADEFRAEHNKYMEETYGQYGE